MKQKKKQKQRKQGSILAFAVIIMSFLMVIAIGLVASSILTRKGANVSSNSTSAFQNTDKGMELFLYELYTNTKPFDTLNQLADSIVDSKGEYYTCDDSSGIAIISGAEFDVVSYKEGDPNVNDGNDFEVATSCNIEIARIYKLKVTGHFATASRSIEVNLNNSLQRGLVSRWTFEDSAEHVRLYNNDGNPQGSPIAKDRSKNDYILTLCPIETEGAFPLPTTGESEICPFMSAKKGSLATGFYMSHLPKWDEGQNAKPDDEGKCYYEDEGVSNEISCGAFVSGVVADHAGGKGVGKGGFNPVDYDTSPDSEDYYNEEYKTGSEALEFNGISHFLAPNLTNKSSDAKNIVLEGSKDNLNFNGKEGMSISLWFNNNSETGGGEDGTGKQVLVSKTDGDNNGYELYLESGKIYFRVNGRTISGEYGGDNQWHHVLARYDDVDHTNNNSGIIIDGGVEEILGLSGAGNITDGPEIPLFVGGVYKGDSADEFDIEKFEGGFGGMIDHVEIFNRYLINFEAQKLCNMAAGEGWQAEDKKIAELCADVEW